MALSEKTIATLGFTASEQSILEVFFSGHSAQGFSLKPISEAASLLIDLKDASGLSKLENWHQSTGKPWIAVVGADMEKPAMEAGIFIDRPLSMKALQDALHDLTRLLSGVRSEAVASAPDAQLSDEDKAREAAFAEWQARKLRSSEAASAWQGEHSHREEEGLRSRFSVQRNELNSLILEAQKEIQAQQAKSGVTKSPVKPAPQAPVEPEAPQAPSMSADMIMQCCGSLSDVNLDSTTERRRVYFSLDGLLLPWVLRAVREGNETGKVQQILGVPGAMFYLPAEKSFLVGIESDLLLQLTRTRFGFDEISLIERGPDQELPKGRRMDSDELVWQLALFTARGRLPDSLSAEEPMLLKEMPDFERLLETPHARSIAELWQSQKLSARNIVSMLGVSQRFVFSFMVAADAIGLYRQ